MAERGGVISMHPCIYIHSYVSHSTSMILPIQTNQGGRETTSPRKAVDAGAAELAVVHVCGGDDSDAALPRLQRERC
jgi:hypothetical protein